MNPPAPRQTPTPTSEFPATVIWLGALVIAVIALGFTPLRASFDEWWHLKSGRYICEHGLPENDVFTYTAESMQWHNHEWLSQVMLWKIFEFGERNGFGGIRTIQGFKTLFLIASYVLLGLFLTRKLGASAIAGLAVLVGFGLTRRTIYFRPPFLSYGILIVLLVLLLNWRLGGKRRHGLLVILPPIFALWANLHGGFIAGLVFVGAFWAETVADHALARWRLEDPRPSASALKWISAIFAACIAATLLNPYTWHLYELTIRVMGDKNLAGILYELLPPDWNYVWIVDAILVLLCFSLVRPNSPKSTVFAGAAAAIILVTIKWLSGFGVEQIDQLRIGAWTRELMILALLSLNALRTAGRAGFALWGLNIFFAHQAIQHVRHLPLWGIVLAPFLFFCLIDWMNGDPARMNSTPQEELDTEDRKVWMPRAASAWTVFLALFFWLSPGEIPNALPGILSSPGEFLGHPLAGSNLGRNLDLLRGHQIQERDYPIRAVDHLIDARLPGRIWNAANYAGYLIWRLSPEKHKVFTDTRYDIWGGKFLAQEFVVRDAFTGDPSRNLPSWSGVLDHWKVNTIFIPVEANLHTALTYRKSDADAVWRLDYQDDAYAIWTRIHPISVDETSDPKGQP